MELFAACNYFDMQLYVGPTGGVWTAPSTGLILGALQANLAVFIEV